MILLMVLSCLKYKYLWKNILSKHKNVIIFYANSKQKESFILKNRILSLQCNDTYDCLPEKIIMMIKSIIRIPIFKSVTHIMKIDDHDTKFGNNLEKKIRNILFALNKLNLSDNYLGQRLHIAKGIRQNRTYHFGKCPKNSYWYKKKYNGVYKSWLDGGCGYILSRKSLKLLDNYFPNNNEDLILFQIKKEVLLNFNHFGGFNKFISIEKLMNNKKWRPISLFNKYKIKKRIKDKKNNINNNHPNNFNLNEYRYSSNQLCINLKKIREQYIYEDLMIAQILFTKNIYPLRIPNIIIGDK